MRAPDPTASPDAAPARPAFAQWTTTTNEVTRLFLAPPKGCILLAGGLPAPEVYPVQAIEDATQRALRTQGANALGYGPVEGLTALRREIASRLSTPERPVGVENVLVTTGSMQALELIGKVLLDPGDAVLAQYPTYLGALDAWRPRLPVYRPIDWQGDDAAMAAAMTGAKFTYTVPNFSNPTGALVPTADRARILAAAQRTGVWLIEDDPYGALHYDGDGLPSLLSLSARPGNDLYRGPVAYLGTLSKTLAPGLRIGWVVGDPDLIAVLSVAKQSSDLVSSAFAQSVALELMRAGIDREQVPRICAIYKARRDAIWNAAQAHLADRFTFEKPVGGMFLWLTARDPALDTDRVYKAALAEGVSICPSSVFDATGANKRSLRLNFTFNDEARIEEGVRRLARALDKMA